MKQSFLRGYALAMIILTSGILMAQPAIPHQFWGSITDGSGNPAPDRLLVIARINGGDVAATSTSGGNYGLNPIFYVQDPKNNRQGRTIEFFVNNIKVGEQTFSNGETNELNLVSTENFGSSSPPPSSGGGGGGGSSGGGGGSSSSSGSSRGSNSGTSGTTTISGSNAKDSSCTQNWECSDWLDCVGTIQKRVCIDVNNCGTEDERPTVSRECLSSDLQRSFILGAVIGPGGRLQPLGLVIFAVVIFAGVVGVRYHHKRKVTKNRDKNVDEPEKE